MTRPVQPGPAHRAEVRTAPATKLGRPSPRLIALPAAADRPYPQYSISTARLLRAIDLLFDGIDAVAAVSRVAQQTFGRKPGVTDQRRQEWAESAARHPSAGGPRRPNAPVLRLVPTQPEG